MGESLEGTGKSFQVDPEGLLFYPTLFTCLGILAFFLLSGATWEICRRSRMCRMKLPGNTILFPELSVAIGFIVFSLFRGEGRGGGKEVLLYYECS